MASKYNAENTILVLKSIFATHGLPEQIVSDNGPTFASKEFQDYCKSRGIKSILVPPYSPSSNGQAERGVRSFKEGLKKALGEGGGGKSNIKAKLINYLLRYRATPHATTGKSPAELLFGRKIRTKLDLVHPRKDHQTKQVTKAQERQKKNYDKSTKEKFFKVGDRVWARNYRGKKFWAEAIVIEAGSRWYLVKTKLNMPWKRHANQL